MVREGSDSQVGDATGEKNKRSQLVAPDQLRPVGSSESCLVAIRRPSYCYAAPPWSPRPAPPLLSAPVRSLTMNFPQVPRPLITSAPVTATRRRPLESQAITIVPIVLLLASSFPEGAPIAVAGSPGSY